MISVNSAFGINRRRLLKSLAALSAPVLLRTAAAYGIAPETTNSVLGLLAAAGVLDDFPAHLHRSLPDYLRARLAPELACASLADGDGDGGARTIARRRAAYVRVYGASRIGACVATFLAASGIARVSCRDGGLARPADLAPAGLGTGDIGAPRAAGVARAIHRIAPETRTSDDMDVLPESALVRSWGGRALAIAFEHDRSTTKLLQKVRAQQG